MNTTQLKNQDYTNFQDANEGLIYVQSKDKNKYWAVFDESATQLTPFIYESIEPYKQGYAIATILLDNVENKYFPGMKNESEPTDKQSIVYHYSEAKRVKCLIAKSGQVFKNSYFEQITLKEDNVYHLTAYLGYIGYLTVDGIYMYPQFLCLSQQSNGYFRIQKGEDENNNRTYAMIDKNGNYVIPPNTYIALGLFNELGATFYMKKDHDEFGYIDVKGNTFNDKEINNKLIYVDKNGNPAPISRLGDIRKGIDNSICFVGANKKYGFSDDDGNIFIKAMYDDVSTCFWGGLAFVQKNNKWGFIDKNNNEITPIIYESVGFIALGYAQALLDDVMYLISKEGVIASKKGGYFGHKVKRLDPKTQNKRYSCGIDFFWGVLDNCWFIRDTLDDQFIANFSEDFTYMKYDTVTNQYFFETGKNKGITIEGKPIKIEEPKKESDIKSEIGEKALIALQALYGNMQVPTLWAELLLKDWAWKDKFSQGIELLTDPCVDLGLWFDITDETEIQTLSKTFYYIANADGSGSFYAYFVTDESKPLDEAPIVFFGSEGELNIVASNLVELLQLISIDTEPMGSYEMDKTEIISFYKNMDEEASKYKENYITWLKEHNIKPIIIKQQLEDQPKSATSIIKKANKQYLKKLYKIYNKYFE
ncbi:WG repeat-containing protein [Orbaceae bacterium ac157xtp]